MEDILKMADEIQEEMVAWRRYLHAHPEIGFSLPATWGYVSQQLEAMGYEPKEIGGGIVAVLEGAAPGKTIMLRADMDALPMEEDSGLPFASENPGMAHTCGHDTHTAMLLGAAKILMAHKDKIKGKVKLVFQPAEELGLGALQMIEDGVLEDPKVDMAMGIHQVVARENLPTGTIAYAPGPAMASADLFKITVTGKGAHGAAPEAGIDPINILVHIHMALQTISTREKPSLGLILTIGQFSAGDAPNIIPHSGFMTGSLRTFDQSLREQVKKRIVEIAEKTAELFGGVGEVTFSTGMAPLINDPVVTAEVAEYLRDAFGYSRICEIPPVMGSEDFSYFLLNVPGTFFRVSLGSQEEGYKDISHHPKVIFNEAGFATGAGVYAITAIRWLENN